MKSIRFKITMSMVLICIIGMAMLTAISYQFVRNIIINETLDKTQNANNHNAEKINSWFNTRIEFINIVAKSLLTDNNTSSIEKTMASQVDSIDNVSLLFTALDDESLLLSVPVDLPEDFKATTRPWYIEAMNAGGNLAFSTYLDVNSSKMVMTLSKNIGKIQDKQAVIGADILIDNILDIVSKSNTNSQIYSFLIDDKNNIVVHPDSSFLPTAEKMINISNVENYKNLQSADGTQKFKFKDYDGIEKYFISSKITNTNWTLFTAIPEKIILTSVYKLLAILITLLVIVNIIAVIIIWFAISKLIVKPLSKLSQASKLMASGDFNNLKLETNSNDEIGLLSQNFKTVANTMHTVIGSINTMHDKHSNGSYKYKIDVDKFSGDYKTVVQGINGLTEMYIDNFVELLDIMQQFKDGNFDININKYKGELSSFNKTIEDLKYNFQSLSDEINNFATSAYNGQFDTQVDEDKYNGQWKEMAIRLNSIMDAVSKPIREASDVLLLVSKGNLNVKVEGEYNGEFNIIKNSLNATIDELASYVKEISCVLEEISNKNLTKHINKNYLGDFVAIKNSINKIIDTLNFVFTDLSKSANNVNLSSGQVSELSETLANGATKQSIEIRELTTALMNIKDETIENAKNSTSVNILSEKALENANSSSQEMSHMLKAMESIKDASSEIAKIIKVIDDIAFQTNLLALNAAVEAARAGASGKGFAVVADEVRSLALRSKNAASETSKLITDAIQKVNEGTEIANITSDALYKIVENVTEVSGLIKNFADVSANQANVISKLNDGLGKISDVVTNNTALSQESAAASQLLSVQSTQLENMLDEFKLA